MKHVLILLLITFQIVSSFDLGDDECLDLFRSFVKPKSCCNLPKRHILVEHQEKCKKACEKLDDQSKGCCAIDCAYHKTGVIQKGNFDDKALLELYENDLNEKGAGKFDAWLPAVEKSIENCVKMIPKTSEMFICDVPQFILDILDCVDQQNFLNCPKFSNSTKCQELKNFMENPEKCSKKVNGNFIVDYRIFEEIENQE